MELNKYFVAVQIEDGSELFEVFDYIVLPKDSDSDKRWAEGVLKEHYIMDCSDKENVNIGAILQDGEFLANPEKEIDRTESPQKMFSVISENKIFGLFFVHEESHKAIRYKYALECKVIIINGKDYPDANLGYIWNGKSFFNPEYKVNNV